jgi:putative membrane protein
MRYVKVFIVVFLALLAIIFVIENIEILKHPVQLGLNLYVVNLETPPIPLWVIIILSFGLGAVLILIYFLYDHIKQRQNIRQLQQNIEILTEDLKRTEVRAGTSSAPVMASPATAESEESTKEE